MHKKIFSQFSFISLVHAADDETVGGAFQEGLRDIKPPVDFPSNYLFYLIIILILTIGGIAAWIYFRRLKMKKVEAVPVDTRLPWEIAYEQFDELEGNNFLDQGQFKLYYSHLSDIVRQYFENRFKIRAPEMTTEEFLWSLEESRDLTLSQKSTLKQFMNSCDIVKFAKHIPRTEEAKESFQLAKQLVQETKKTTSDQLSA